MELRHLRYFLTVAEELNFSKAAEKLFISQPPLSRQIKELETDLQAKLFERNTKKVSLTDAGKYFEKEVRELLIKLERTCQQTKKIAAHVSGEFRIAYISSTFSRTIPDLLHHLTHVFPFVSFKLYEIPTAKQIAALEQGKLDLGIIRAPLYSESIHAQVWFRDRYSLVYSPQHLTISSDEDLEKLQELTFIFFNREYAPHNHQTLLEICARFGFQPNIGHECNNINSIMQLIKNGLGVSILPSSISKNYAEEELVFYPLEKIEAFSEVLLATPKNEVSAIGQKAIAFLLQTHSPS